MKLSKYFLSAFAFVIAVGGAIGSAMTEGVDYIVTAGGPREILTLGPSCLAMNQGALCTVQVNGVSIPTFSTLSDAQAGTNPQQRPL